MTTGLGLHAQAACQVVTDSDFRLLGERASYVSWEGMFLETREQVAVGDAVIVSLCAPRTGEWLDAEASVARVVPLDGEGAVFGVGLRFQAMDEQSRATLTVALGPQRADLDAEFRAARRG